MLIAITGQKGGTGKSTLAICLAVELMAQKNKVLLLDADRQGTSTTWHDVAIENGHPAPELQTVTTPKELESAIQGLEEEFDFVLIDLPSNLSALPLAALILSDVALIPCGSSATEMWALTETVSKIQEARKLNPTLRAFAVQTRIQTFTRAGRSLRSDLAQWGIDVLYQALSQRLAYQASIAAGLGVTTYPGAGPAKTEVQDLLTELFSKMKGE